MRVSCAVMAHPSRGHLIPELLDRLGLTEGHVVWDRRDEEWDTGVRAWQAYDPDADWHLVIQDDAVTCRDLLVGLEKALEHVPVESVVSLYFGNNRPWQNRIRQIADHAADASWVRMKSLIWGPAIVAPTSTVDDMLTWCEANHNPAYDTRIARYYMTALCWSAYYTWPSLVDHRQVPSLLNHPGERRAHWFLGEHVSAAHLDWAGDVVALDRGGSPKRHPQRMSERRGLMGDILIAKKTAVMYHKGRRVVVRKGLTTAEPDSDIVRENRHLWEPLAVHYRSKPVEQATAAPGEKRDIPLGPKPAEVRAWAKEQGLDVPARGALPAEVVELYKTEHEA